MDPRPSPTRPSGRVIELSVVFPGSPAVRYYLEVRQGPDGEDVIPNPIRRASIVRAVADELALQYRKVTP